MASLSKMQIIKRRGEQRLKLQCHCRAEFWADFENGENIAMSDRGPTGRCPKCGCLWDQNAPDSEAVTPPPPNKKGMYFFKMAVQVGPERFMLVMVGKGRSLPEFMARIAVDMPNSTAGVTISTISEDEYNVTKKKLRKAHDKAARGEPVSQLHDGGEFVMGSPFITGPPGMDMGQGGAMMGPLMNGPLGPTSDIPNIFLTGNSKNRKKKRK